MDATSVKKWAKRAGIITGSVVVIALVAGMWHFSNVIDADLLTPNQFEPEADLQVVSLGEGRIVLSRTEQSALDGVWGLVGPNGYGQVTGVVEVREGDVERGFVTLDGSFAPGDAVAFDQYAFLSDPMTAHGIEYEEVVVPGDLGVNPAWLIDGTRDTWVVIVHGKGIDERKQALRMIPTLHDAGYPLLVISFRNDAGAAASDSGRYTWGIEEWRDLEAALQFGLVQGAEEFVIYGYSMGGAVTATFLHESDLIGRVRGVILDSPVLDLEEVVDTEAAERGIPEFFTAGAKAIARLRFGLDWPQLDHVARADEFDMPILLIHGTADTTVPVASSDDFAAARPDIVIYERFDGADHVYAWNVDPTRYSTAVLNFVSGVATAES
jgi:pimeloyl-ACP methyl ester carboxylesterase